MANPIFENVSSLTQIGRVPVTDPKKGPVYYNYTADFTAVTNKTITFNFNAINQGGIFGIPKSVFVDNGSNPNPVIVSTSITNQTFTVPSFAQGVFTVEATESSEVSFTSNGGATDKGKITLYNYSVPPSVWYSYGTFNNNKAVKVEGAMDDGADVALETNNNPVYIGGIDRATGLFHAVSVDGTGRLDFSSTITLGAVYGVDAVGSAPTKDPVLVAPLDSTGNVGQFKTNSSNELLVNDAANTNPNNSNVTNVAASIVSTLILSANTNRKGAILYNNSTSTVNISFANVDAVITPSVILPANSSVTLQRNDYNGRINAAWTTATGSMLVTEFS